MKKNVGLMAISALMIALLNFNASFAIAGGGPPPQIPSVPRYPVPQKPTPTPKPLPVPKPKPMPKSVPTPTPTPTPTPVAPSVPAPTPMPTASMPVANQIPSAAPVACPAFPAAASPFSFCPSAFSGGLACTSNKGFIGNERFFAGGREYCKERGRSIVIVVSRSHDCRRNFINRCYGNVEAKGLCVFR